MRTIIAGSREGVCYEDVKNACEVSGLRISVVISGCARGADLLGEEYAKMKGIPIERFPADWGAYGKSAGYKRNQQMAENAEALIACWDGVSKGTKNMIDIAKKQGLLVYVHRIRR